MAMYVVANESYPVLAFGFVALVIAGPWIRGWPRLPSMGHSRGNPAPKRRGLQAWD